MKPISEIEKAQLQEIASIAGKPHDQTMRNLLLRYDQLELLAKRAHDIMSFHTHRCPMDIMNNFSGSEEHLDEFRSVMNALKKII